MKTSHDILRDRLLRNVTAQEHWQKADAEHRDMSAMSEMQWDSNEWQYILSLMKNRMIMGGYRYGPTKLQKPREFDNIADIKRRLELYEKEGNMEHLVDAANITIIECLKKSHPNFHFSPTDDGVHAERIRQ
jgi:transcriptional regulator of heat shock response